MKVRVAEASGCVLDYMVAKCEGINTVRNHPGWAYIPKGKRSYYKWTPTTNWKQGGPIIEREGLSCEPFKGKKNNWRCFELTVGHVYAGPTPLIAAMRCYVASKLGDEVEVPDELLRGAIEHPV